MGVFITNFVCISHSVASTSSYLLVCDTSHTEDILYTAHLYINFK